MATQYAFGSIVTNGLVLALNAADKNSYPGSGTTWTDMSGNGNNGTLTNSPTLSSANGGAIVLDGVDDYVDLGANKVNSSFTFSTWAKPTSTAGTQLILAQGNSENGSYQYLAFRSNLIQFSTDGSITFAESNTSPSANTWYSIVGVYNSAISNKNTLYVNSVLQSTFSTSSANFLGNLTMIGRSTFGAGSAWFNGNIASVQIYNRALSASEIAQNYNAQKSRFGL
jgi:hypothetical protein